MSEVFETRVRRLGNSLAVIIPKKILKEVGAKEGDVLRLSVPVPKSKRKEVLRRLAGIDQSAEPFIREKRDRL